MKQFNFSCLLILTFSLVVFSQNTQSKVDAFVKESMQSRQTAGVAVAIVEEGKVTYAKGFGYANIEHKVPVTVDTIFQLASVGKQFTAAAVMLLVEDGKINLDEKLSKHFEDIPKSWNGITVRHLLTHTSGLGDYPNDFDYRRDYTEAEIFKLIKQSNLSFKPGEKWEYSNFGYVTLGVLIRKVSGKFYGDFLQERIFKPLEMKTARVISEADIIQNRAAGYTLVDGQLKNQSWISPTLNTTADGALYMSLNDLSKWDAALYGEKILKQSSLEQMWSPVKLNSGKTYNYGFGWSLGRAKRSKVVQHSGGWQGFSAYIARFIDAKTTVFVFENLSQGTTVKIALGVAEIYNPELGPRKAQVIRDEDPKTTEFAKKILQEITDGTIKKDAFNTNAQKELYPNLKGIGTQLKPLGQPSKFELVEKTSGNELKQLKYKVTFESFTLNYLLVLDKQGKIVGIALRPK